MVPIKKRGKKQTGKAKDGHIFIVVTSQIRKMQEDSIDYRVSCG